MAQSGDSGSGWLGLIGLLGAAGLASAAQLYANKKNVSFAKSVNDTSIELANTAHQREVADLRAAGLNPILSASGSGAAMPSLTAPTVGTIGDAIGHSANSIADNVRKALNGQYSAEAQMSKAEAGMASRQNEIEDHHKAIMNQAFERSQLADIASAEAEERASQNQFIDESARHEALVGYGDRIYNEFGQDIYHRDSQDYRDLVRMYKRQIENDSWSASGWKRGIDTAGSVLDLVAGARNAVRKDVSRGAKSGKNVNSANKKKRLKAFDDARGVKVYE